MQKPVLDAIPCLNAGYVALTATMGDDRTPAKTARTSFANTQNERTVEQDARLTSYLVRHEHTTPLEFCQLRFYIKAPIFVARQMMRHRTASVNEISLRYVDAAEEYYIPELNRMVGRAKDVKQGSGGERIEFPMDAQYLVDVSCEESFATYQELKKLGVAPEIARTVLPLGTYTEFYWQNDLNNTLKYLKLRLAPDAQYEHRVYAEAMLELTEEKFPTVVKAWRENDKARNV